MRRFFCEKIDNTTILTGSEANHIANVLRMGEGDHIVLFDGSGYEYECEITGTGKGTVTVHEVRKTFSLSEPEIRITLYSSSIKKDNLDLVFQKISELGAASFCVYDSARSVKKIKDPEKLKEHLKRVGIEASKQCGRSVVPEVEVLSSLKEVASRISSHDVVIFAYEEEKAVSVREILSKQYKNIGIIVGPEGGFERSEAELLISSGAKVCSLGKLILRAETAGIAAVAMVMYAEAL